MNNEKHPVSGRTVADARAERAKHNEFVQTSYIYTVSFLVKLEQNPELAEQYNLSPMKITMLKMRYGINKERHAYSVEEIAEKLEVTENKVIMSIASALKSIRNIKEFESIKEGLHNQ